MANFLVFAWTFVHLSLSFSWALMRPFLSLFFQYIAHAFAGENFGKRLYDIWNIKKDMHEWMVWKCYSSNVEVFACRGGVYVILDHESMKRNSQGSQNLTKLNKIQAACRNDVFVGFMHMALVGIFHHRGTFYFVVFKDLSSGRKILLRTDLQQL